MVLIPGDYGPALALLPDAGARLFASPILLPGGSITVPGLSTTGVSFTFTGTLTQNDTLALTQTGDPCLQSPPSYCTNGAGVVTVAGTSPVGAATTFTGTFGGTTASWDFWRSSARDLGRGHGPDIPCQRRQWIRQRNFAFELNAVVDLAFRSPPLPK